MIAGKIVHIAGGEREIYSAIAESIRDCDPYAVILFGDELDWLARALMPSTMVLAAPTPADVVALLETLVNSSTAILLKGSSRNTRIKELSGLLRSMDRT